MHSAVPTLCMVFNEAFQVPLEVLKQAAEDAFDEIDEVIEE